MISEFHEVDGSSPKEWELGRMAVSNISTVWLIFRVIIMIYIGQGHLDGSTHVLVHKQNSSDKDQFY